MFLPSRPWRANGAQWVVFHSSCLASPLKQDSPSVPLSPFGHSGAPQTCPGVPPPPTLTRMLVPRGCRCAVTCTCVPIYTCAHAAERRALVGPGARLQEHSLHKVQFEQRAAMAPYSGIADQPSPPAVLCCPGLSTPPPCLSHGQRGGIDRTIGIVSRGSALLGRCRARPGTRKATCTGAGRHRRGTLETIIEDTEFCRKQFRGRGMLCFVHSDFRVPRSYGNARLNTTSVDLRPNISACNGVTATPMHTSLRVS